MKIALILLLASLAKSNILISQLTMKVNNVLDVPIQFELCSESDTLRSNQKGVLEINPIKLNQHRNTIFFMKIVKENLRSKYSRDLYFTKESSSSHIDGDSVTLAKIIADQDQLFILRQEEQMVLPNDKH